jgi:dTDP-4-amino-4,6-dideoxygalactose transaminase
LGIKDEMMGVTEEVYASQHLILGPKVEELEKKIADLSGVRRGPDRLCF